MEHVNPHWNAWARLLGLVLILSGVGAKNAARSGGGPRAYLDEPPSWYAGDEARTVAANMLSYQSPLGGWPKNIDTTARLYRGEPDRLKPTFDNNATMDEMRLLARMYVATKDEASRKAVEKSLDYILKAQYPTGGWPQFYPPDRQYHRRITFNDGVMVRVLELLRDVYTSDTFSFVDQARKDAARQAFDRGIQCILKCQIKVDGKLTAWCAQHDELDYSPQPGRTFELASISGAESVGVAQLLMSLDDPSPEVVRAVQASAAWFEAAKIVGIRVDEKKDASLPKGKDRVVVQDPAAAPMWARFYEIGTNKPIFADRDGVAKHQLSEIGYERRNGYRWLNYWPQQLLEKDYPAWKSRWASRIPTTQAAE